MIDSMPAADIANAERFERIGLAATLQTAARTRDEFADWLRRSFDLDPVRLSDLVLAINEALANSAEFAYRGERRGRHHGPAGLARPGRIRPSRSSSPTTASGEWRDSRAGDPQPRTRNPLDDARLSDRTAIETSLDGTRCGWCGPTCHGADPLPRQPVHALPGHQRQVERGPDARRGGHARRGSRSRSGPPRRGWPRSCAPPLRLVGHDVDDVRRLAGDLDAVRAAGVRGLRPVRAQVGAQARDVLDDDDGLARRPCPRSGSAAPQRCPSRCARPRRRSPRVRAPARPSP